MGWMFKQPIPISTGWSLLARVSRRVAGSEERLHDAAVDRVDLPVAIDVVLAEVRLVGRAERRLNQAAVHRVHLPVAVGVTIAHPLGVTSTAACLADIGIVAVRAGALRSSTAARAPVRLQV